MKALRMCAVVMIALVSMVSAATAEQGLPFSSTRVHRTQPEMVQLIDHCARDDATCGLSLPYDSFVVELNRLGVSTTPAELPRLVENAPYLLCSDVFGDSEVPFEYVTPGLRKDRTVVNGVAPRKCRKNEHLIRLNGANGFVYLSDWCFNPAFVEEQERPKEEKEVWYQVPSMHCRKFSMVNNYGERIHPTEVFADCR